MVNQLEVSDIAPTRSSVPRVPADAIDRTRILNEQLGAREATLIGVTAAAGYGKTTLVGQWLQQVERPCAWVSLDATDNDPSYFWHRVLESVVFSSHHHQRYVTDLLHAESLESPRAVLGLVLQVLRSVPTPVVVVWDDFHLIDEAELIKSIRYFVSRVANTAPHVQLVVTSRTDLPHAVVSAVRHDDVIYIAASELRMTPEEIQKWCSQTLGEELTEAQRKQLEERTEGWLAGLHYLALTGQTGVGSSPGQRQVQNYGELHPTSDQWLDAMFRTMSDNTREFLLSTAILPRFCAPLCAAVLSDSSAAAILRHLVATNTFVVSLGDGWYRYHHLFRDLLLERLKAEHGETLRALYARAAEWFHANELIRDAVDHALSARDFAAAEGWLMEFAPTMLQRRESVTLQRWFDAFPAAHMEGSAGLCIVQAWMHALSGQNDRALQSICHAEARTADADVPVRQREDWAMECHALRGYVAMLRLQTDTAQSHFSASVQLGSKYSRFFRFGLDLSGGEPLILRTRLGLRGYLRRVEQLYPSLRNIWKDSGLAILGYGSAALGELYYEKNQLSELAYFIPRGLELGRAFSSASILLPMYLLHARTHLASGDIQEAEAVLEEADKVATQYGGASHWREILQAVRVRIWIREHRSGDVASWVDARAHLFEDELLPSREFELIAYARALIHLGRCQEARDLLLRLYMQAVAEDRLASRVELLIVRACVLWKLDKRSRSRSMLYRAVSLAASEGYCRTFLDEGEPLLEQLHELYQSWPGDPLDAAREYIKGLIEQFSPPLTSTTAEQDFHPVHPSERLTSRELDVLQYVAKGLSNAEIARTLCISVGTVKAYCHHLFEKLEAKNRTQAVVNARARGIRV